MKTITKLHSKTCDACKRRFRYATIEVGRDEDVFYTTTGLIAGAIRRNPIYTQTLCSECMFG